MPLKLDHLDAETRAHMLAEIERDVAAGSLYLGKRLTEFGCAQYPDLLREAAREGDADTLRRSLGQAGCLKAQEFRQGKPVKVPVTAAETLAEGEFMRFYARGVCLVAMEQDHQHVRCVRVKDVERERDESRMKVGQTFEAAALLKDLRIHPGVDTALGLPAGPNSGICVVLVAL